MVHNLKMAYHENTKLVRATHELVAERGALKEIVEQYSHQIKTLTADKRLLNAEVSMRSHIVPW
jgi:hypothetical protein